MKDGLLTCGLLGFSLICCHGFAPALARMEPTVFNQQQPLNTSAGFLLPACCGQKEGVSLFSEASLFSSFQHAGKMLLVLAALGKDFSPADPKRRSLCCLRATTDFLAKVLMGTWGENLSLLQNYECRVLDPQTVSVTELLCHWTRPQPL